MEVPLIMLGANQQYVCVCVCVCVLAAPTGFACPPTPTCWQLQQAPGGSLRDHKNTISTATLSPRQNPQPAYAYVVQGLLPLPSCTCLVCEDGGEHRISVCVRVVGTSAELTLRSYDIIHILCLSGFRVVHVGKINWCSVVDLW